MKKLFSLFIGLLIITSILPLQAQDLISNSSLTGVCYAGVLAHSTITGYAPGWGIDAS